MLEQQSCIHNPDSKTSGNERFIRAGKPLLSIHNFFYWLPSATSKGIKSIWRLSLYTIDYELSLLDRISREASLTTTNPEACIDIVFIHGLKGHPDQTWRHNKSRIHWPTDFLRKDIPDCRILNFGYDADILAILNSPSLNRLHHHAENLVGDLVRHRERTGTQDRAILFVAHSLGGLVTQAALNMSEHNAKAYLRQIERCTAGIVFLGTPHSGSGMASLSEAIIGFVKVFHSANNDIISVLEPCSEVLEIVQGQFYQLLQKRVTAELKLEVTCFSEELPIIHNELVSGKSLHYVQSQKNLLVLP